MRKALFALITLFTLVFCKSEYKEKNIDNRKNQKIIEPINLEENFKKWLIKQNLKRNKIVDTTSIKAPKLWAFRGELTNFDSAFYRYPSKDSSYYLITNFNRETKERITSKYSNDIKLRFFKKESQEVFLGIILLDSLKKKNIDFYWYNASHFYFTENEKGKEKKHKIISKLKMEIDSIWSYKIEQ